ncbi:MAG TPA: low-specificity L-threonine aldolase [Anaerolineaceae bacterium]|nr:low-specificity L-threonine aldolase [Anaerolineaceae bacterium]
MKIVDLRSDTVTVPTPAMRAAMATAEVGDDVMGEDPSVNRLQEVAAERMGKEAGLFVPSGTMGNLAAILAHCGRGDEVIIGDLSHTFLFEGGGVAALGGVMPHTLPNLPDGRLDPGAIRNAIRPDDVHQPVSRLLVLENTHNRCGGTVLDAAYFEQVHEITQAARLKLHIDGARIFNAAVALGVPAKTLVATADSVTFCLSKALCAPVGSVLCGSTEFIRTARRIRKQLGGGMRQAGILAAAGLVALDEMVDRLAEDHRRARLLAAGLEKIPGILVETKVPASNMVFISLEEKIGLSGVQVCGRLAEAGVKVGTVGARRFRLVTHYWIDDEGVEQTLDAFRKIL